MEDLNENDLAVSLLHLAAMDYWMITYYCPNCWKEISEDEEVCSGCSYLLEEYSRLTLEQKLIMSLNHPIPDSRMMAVQVLGNLGNVQALPTFKNIIEEKTNDFYLLREVIKALAKIQHPKSVELLGKPACTLLH